jgi:hypothetical protein
MQIVDGMPRQIGAAVIDRCAKESQRMPAGGRDVQRLDDAAHGDFRPPVEMQRRWFQSGSPGSAHASNQRWIALMTPSHVLFART